MEEIEVTLHTDGNDIEVVRDSNTDTGLMNEDETETQRSNPEGVDSCSLHLDNNVNDCASETNEFCVTRNITSTSNYNDAEGCTDKVISEIAVLGKPIQKKDRDLECSLKTDSDVTEENYENCLIFTKKSINSTCDSVSSSLQSDIATSCAAVCNLLQDTDTAHCVVKNETSEKRRCSVVIVDKEGKPQGCEVDVITTVQDKCVNKFNEDKREQDGFRTASILNKSFNGNSKIFQLDLKQQTSEIKERVMSYLNKYAGIDENTSIDQKHSPALLKDQISKEEKSCVDNENTSSSIDSRNSVKELNCNDSYIGVTTNVCESTVPNVKLPVHVLQNNTFSLDEAAQPPDTLPQTNGNENSIQSTTSTFITEPSFQICKLILDTPACKELSPSCASTALGFVASSKNEQFSSENKDNSLTQCDNIEIDMECCQVGSTSRMKIDAFSFQTSSGKMSNQDQVQRNMYFKETNAILQQCELSRNSKPSDFNNLLLDNASSSKKTMLSSNPNVGFLNQHTQTLRGNNLNSAQDISTFSWGRLSFQPFTTPSINFPILSCKSSSDKNSTKQTFKFNGVLPVSNSQTKNDNSTSLLLPQWSPKNCTESRKAKSSEAICFSTSLSLSTGEGTFLKNVNKTQVPDYSYIGKPVNLDSELSALAFGKPSSLIPSSTGINANKNICNAFEDSIGESSNTVKTSLTDNVSSRHGFASGSCRSSSEKPLSTKSSVESIGLFKMPPVKQAAEVIGNLSFKPDFSSQSLYPLQRERNEVEGHTRDEGSSGFLKQDACKEKSQLSFPPDALTLNRQTMYGATDFSYNNVVSHEHLQSRENFTFKSEQTSNECRDRQSPCLNASKFTMKSKSSSLPFQFTFNVEKNEVEGHTRDKGSSDFFKQDACKEKSQFSFPPDALTLNRQTMNGATDFSYNNVVSHEHLQSRENFTFKSEQTSNECKDRQSPCLNASKFTMQNESNSLPFQFTFNAEKTKTNFTKGMPCSRRIKKAVKLYKHDRSSPTNIKDVGNVSNFIEKGTGHVLFKPVYGSDVKAERGISKNVIVRYQNIVLMDEFLDTSPEELRSKYYAKTYVCGPFKFTTTTDADQIYNCKKTHNQETQTEKQLAPKKSELAGIWRALECPVCFDVVLPPVYQCDQGHHVCSTCWNKVVTCPLCKRFKSVTRNYMAEALVEQVPLPCKYHIEGCKETVQHVNKVNHEETCTFRMYECPVPLCNQAHSYQNMCKHFKKAHKTLVHHEGHSVGKGEKFCDVLYKEAVSLFLIHAFDIAKWGLFFLRKVTVHSSSALFVQIMPAVADQAVYFYHLEVSDHHDCRKECYKGRVFSMGKSTQDIVDQEEYLCLSDLILKTVNKNTPLKIVVTIWQLKPAFSLSTD